MTSQERRAAGFRALHLAPPILVLANVWDASGLMRLLNAEATRLAAHFHGGGSFDVLDPATPFADLSRRLESGL